MAKVTLQNLRKLYPGNPHPAVNDIHLDIQDREFIVLVGPSGCGKSTTLRMIAGLEDITAGTIQIGDRIVNDVPPKDRDIAMVFQNYALYPHMTVYKNMAFGLHLRRKELGLSKQDIDTRVREAARILGITPYLDRKPKALSGGQRQRVAVGRAIVRNPQAFLFDEPLSNLDAKLRVETRAEIKKLHQRLKTTTIYVTHDQEEAMTLGDRIVVMKDGVIQQCAPPSQVYDQPVNRFVAGFVGTPAMNFLSGRLTENSFTFGNQSLRLLPATQNLLAAHRGKEVVLGIRPESLGLTQEGCYGGTENAISGRVAVVEPLGDRVDVTISMDGGESFGEGQSAELPHGSGSTQTRGTLEGAGRQLVCRVDAHGFGGFGKWEIGDIMKVYVDLSRVHVFETGEHGVNLTLARDTSHVAA